MLTTTVEMRGLSNSLVARVWIELSKNMMVMSFRAEKSSALKIAMVALKLLHLVQEVNPGPSLDQDLGLGLGLDLDPREDPLLGVEVALGPGLNPDPNQEANRKMQQNVQRNAVAPGAAVLGVPGPDLLEIDLDHDLQEINPGLDLLKREEHPGPERINLGPDPGRRANQGPDLHQSLPQSHAGAKVGQSPNLRANLAQDLLRMIQRLT